MRETGEKNIFLRKGNKMRRIAFLFIVVGLAISLSTPSFGQGIFMRGVGAINESFGGTAVGAPLDSMGALTWNPATISALPQSEMGFSAAMILPNMKVTTPYGEVNGQPGVAVAPNFGIVSKNPCSRWTFGLGLSTLGGAKAAYPSLKQIAGPDPTIAALGTLNADIMMLQFAPTASYQLTEKLSVGFAPTLTMAQILCDPLYISIPPDGAVRMPFPSGTSSRYMFGGGFQFGLFYNTQCNWAFGFSYKSPQWMEPFRFQTEETDAATGEVYSYVRKLHITVPQIISFGASYYGFQNTLLAADLRYYIYDGCGDVKLLGWHNTFSLHLGAQRIINERLTARMGYVYNDNPIPDSYAYRNLASPICHQHMLYIGGSIKLTEQIEATLCYGHTFRNSLNGETPIGTPISVSTAADMLALSMRVLF